MFNVGVGFMVFGLMMWLYEMLPKLGAGKRLTTTARIVGYKLEPTPTDFDNISLYRVVAFKNPQTDQTLEMFSNPGVANPEPIGTEIQISFNPQKTNPDKDFVWIEGGMRSAGKIAQISFVTGLIVFIILLFVPKSSALHFILIVPAFAVVFIGWGIVIGKRPNQ